MRILVTGGLGVNGAYVARSLLRKGVDVVVFDASQDTSLLGDATDRVTIVRGDIRDMRAVRSTVADQAVNRIIHLAALLTPAAQAEPLLALDVNVMGMRNIMAAALESRVDRVIFASSKAAYGPLLCEHGAPTYVPVSEDHPLMPRNFYDYTKIMCEGIGTTIGKASGIEFAALRFATIYGPGRMVRHQSRLKHSLLIESALAGVPFTEDSCGGGDLDDLIYVGDVAEALVAAAMTASLRHDVYNIGTGVLNSLSTFAEAARQLVPEACIDVEPTFSPSQDYSCVFGTDRAKADLGFVANTNLSENFKRYRDALSGLQLPPLQLKGQM